MADNPRIEDLRRRVEKDPASIAFAQLAEEYRRAGRCEEAVAVCRAGLVTHPGYLSARVTLGRALIELEEFSEAQSELDLVLRSASENLAAIRGLAEIHHRRGELPQALAQYRAALALARNDPDLEQTVEDLTRQVTPRRAAAPQDGLTAEQMQREMAVKIPALHAAAAPPPEPAAPVVKEPAASVVKEPAAPAVKEPPPRSGLTAPPAPPISTGPPPPPIPAMMRAEPRSPASDRAVFEDPDRARAVHTLAALDQWLTALHVARADRSP